MKIKAAGCLIGAMESLTKKRRCPYPDITAAAIFRRQCHKEYKNIIEGGRPMVTIGWDTLWWLAFRIGIPVSTLWISIVNANITTY